MAWAATAIGAVSAGYNIYNSAHKESQAKKLAAANKRPVFNPDGSIQQVYDLALSDASNTGLQDFGAQQLEQQQSQGIDAILKSGGKADYATISNAYGSQLNGLLATLSKNRDQKIAAVNNAAYNVAKSKDAAFQYNQDAPYKDNLQAVAQLKQESAQSLADGISAAASTAANYLTATTKPGNYGDKNTGNTGERVAPAAVSTIDTPSSQSLAAPAYNPIGATTTTKIPHMDANGVWIYG